MSTYKNKTAMNINYETGGKIYNFPAGRETALGIYVPYKELGLELVDENYPPLKSKVLVSGKFKFSRGMERRINIPHCEGHKLKVSVKSGSLKLYLGGGSVGIELSGDYEGEHEWSFVPYVKLLGLEDGTEAEVYGEVTEA